MVERTAIAVMRIQPLHKGHTFIINKMCEDFKNVIVCVGSTNVSDKWNPWSFEVRKEMLKNIYGDRIKIVQLADIGTQEGSTDWVDYVIDKVHKLGLPDPTDYFTGSEADARWYSKRFSLTGGMGDFAIPGQLPSAIQMSRVLHIVDRSQNNVPPATDLRTFLELADNGWKPWIPEVNHDLVLDNYPKEFIIGQSNAQERNTS